MSSKNMKYWAFISYSSKDRAVAKKLHRKLETYRIPRALVGRPGRDRLVPKKIFPVFRDRTELPLSSDLGSTIEDALYESRYLIVICSPNSAESRWVNEEIRHFKALGRENQILALIIDGEPNATSDDKFDVALECFPPALRHPLNSDGSLDLSNHVEPIAGDLRKGGDGWKAAFLKAVAGITGLGYDAFAKREQKRQRLRRIFFSIASIAFLIGGLGWWDYTRIKTQYYAYLTTRWSIPEGVTELTPEQVAHRQFSYKVESSRRKIRRIYYVNSAGKLRNEVDNFNASTRVIQYDEKGNLRLIILRNRNDVVTCRKEFSDLKDTPIGKTRFIEFKSEHNDAPLSLKSGLDTWNSDFSKKANSDITVHRVLYHDDGLLHSEHYLNTFKAPQSNTQGIFGKLYQYGTIPIPSKITFLDHQSSPTENITGRSVEIKTYSPEGHNLSYSAFDSKNQAVLDSDGTHKFTKKFDKYGNKVEWTFYDIDNSTIVKKYISEFDEVGNLIKQAVFGRNEQPSIGKDGCHIINQKFDNYGNCYEWSAYGYDGLPSLDKSKVHKIKWKFDDKNNRIEEAYFDTEDKPSYNREGYHKFIKKLNQKGREIERAH